LPSGWSAINRNYRNSVPDTRQSATLTGIIYRTSSEIPADPNDELGAAGWPNGQTVMIDDRVCQHPAAPAPPDTVEFDGGLLVVEPGERPSLTLRLASVGARYLVALGRYDNGGWTPVSPLLEVLDGKVDPKVAHTYPFADALVGLDMTQVAGILANTTPHAIAEAARPADPAARFAATIDQDSPPTTVESTSTDSTAAAPPCTGFVRRYLGEGLTASLPANATYTSGEGTTDRGPIPAGWAVNFQLADESITIGRRVSTQVVPEPNFAQRVDSDVVVFVKANNETLRNCILDLVVYDRARDESDE